MSDPADDPEDTPLLRQVLYTNDVVRVLSSFVAGLLTVAEPERVRKALQHVLNNWPEHVDRYEVLKRVMEQHERRKGSGKH